MKRRGVVLTEIKHGGHVLTEQTPEAVNLAMTRETFTLAEDATGGEVEFSTAFDYLFPNLTGDAEAHLDASDPARVVAALNALGDAMVEESAQPGAELQPTGNSTIPPVYTYWGQFIDHDLTANTDRVSVVGDVSDCNISPLAPAFVVANLKNLRQPTLNLDSVYGDGPTFDPEHPTQARNFYDGIRFKVGRAQKEGMPGDVIPPDGDLDRDLPREDKVAQIADARNDENLIIAQLHTAFLRFHNEVVRWVETNEPAHATDQARFERARQLTTWHHQWLVVHDYLKTITRAGVADRILLGGTKHYEPRDGQPYMPLEFSVAAFRFGHTMVRAAYDYNRNFGRPGVLLKQANFDLLFAFTGKSPNPFQGHADVLPHNWIIEWDRFIDKGSSIPDHFARKIDTLIAPPLATLANAGNGSPAFANQDHPETPRAAQSLARLSAVDTDGAERRGSDGRRAAERG